MAWHWLIKSKVHKQLMARLLHLSLRLTLQDGVQMCAKQRASKLQYVAIEVLSCVFGLNIFLPVKLSINGKRFWSTQVTITV